MNKDNPPSRLGRLLVNHLGFLCEGTKEVIVCGEQDGIFELQDMALSILNPPQAPASRKIGQRDVPAKI